MHDARTEAKRWLAAAREDLAYARHAAAGGYQPGLQALLDAARELDLLYIPTRYPNSLDSGTPGAAFGPGQSKRAIDLAEQCVLASARIAGV